MRQRTCIARVYIAVPLHRSHACNQARVHIHTYTHQPANSSLGVKVYVRVNHGWA